VANGVPLVEYNDGPAAGEIINLWKNIEDKISLN